MQHKNIIAIGWQQTREQKHVGCQFAKLCLGDMGARSSGSTNFVVPVSENVLSIEIAPRLWNILPVTAKNATSRQSFKSVLKDYLFP